MGKSSPFIDSVFNSLISINHQIELKKEREKKNTPPLQAISNLFTVNLFKIIHNMYRRTTNQTVRQVHGVRSDKGVPIDVYGFDSFPLLPFHLFA